MKNLKFIINADDFGRDLSRIKAINEIALAGKCDRISLMMNMPYTKEAIDLAFKGGYQNKVIFHLNLTFGPPLTEAIKNTPLCKDGGFCFASNAKITRKGFSPSVIRAIRAECEEQMVRFRNAGFNSTRIDSHMWVLCNLPVMIAIRPLLKKYGFDRTRTLKGHLFSITKNKKLLLYYKLVSVLTPPCWD